MGKILYEMSDDEISEERCLAIHQNAMKEFRAGVITYYLEFGREHTLITYEDANVDLVESIIDSYEEQQLENKDSNQAG